MYLILLLLLLVALPNSIRKGLKLRSHIGCFKPRHTGERRKDQKPSRAIIIKFYCIAAKKIQHYRLHSSQIVRRYWLNAGNIHIQNVNVFLVTVGDLTPLKLHVTAREWVRQDTIYTLTK